MSQILQFFSPKLVNNDLVVPNPRIKEMRKLCYTYLFIIIMYCMTLPLYVVPFLKPGHVHYVPWSLFLLIPMYCLMVATQLWIIRFWKRLEPLRFAAAAGDFHLRADVQPQPDLTALRLPFLLQSTTQVEYRMTRIAALVLLIFLPIFIFLMLFVGPFEFSLLLSIVCGLVFGVGFIVLLLFLIARTANKSKVEFFVDGVGYRDANKMHFLFWRDIRLFACYADSGSAKRNSHVIYELASNTHVVRWTSPHQPSTWWGLFDWLLLPKEINNDELQPLLASIVARTGLTLYDLSKGQSKADLVPEQSL